MSFLIVNFKSNKSLIQIPLLLMTDIFLIPKNIYLHIYIDL